jgi:hypothetical protein
MAGPLDGLDRYLLITADTHAGPAPEGYGPYLEKKWQADFEGWLVQSAEMAKLIHQMKYNDQCSEHIFGKPTVAKMSLEPSEYFARQCHIGASFLPPKECSRRHEVGVDRILWGTDYPHVEGSYPYTREQLRLSFAGVAPGEIQQMVALNAARVYGFDLARLAPLAARVGPTKQEIARPLSVAELPAAALKCPAFAPYNQRPDA